MNGRPRLVYLVYREGLSSVIVGTVATPLGMLAGRGYDPDLVMLAPVGEFLRPGPIRQWRRRMLEIRAQYRGPVCVLPSPPARLPRLWNEAAMLASWAGRRGMAGQTVVHARGLPAALLGLSLRKRFPDARVVFDMRGLLHAERDQAGPRALPRGVWRPGMPEDLRGLEQYAAELADGVVCVSAAMRDYVVDRFKLSGAKTVVVPNSVVIGDYDDVRGGREGLRRELSLNGRFVVAYAGSMRWWHAPEETLRVFSAIKALNADAFLLALTTQPAKLRKTARTLGLREEDMLVLDVPHGDVPRYLVAGDIGLCILAEGLRTEVCSPIKFAQYLAAGLPCVISDGVGSYTELVEREGIGVVVPHASDEGDRRRRLSGLVAARGAGLDEMRTRCRAVAEREFSWEANLPALMAVYEGHRA